MEREKMLLRSNETLNKKENNKYQLVAKIYN